MSISWDKLVCLSDAELVGFDVAQVNLACAVGLPHFQAADVVALSKKLDGWAKEVRKTTRQLYSRYDAAPAEFGHSKSRFRVMALVEVLQRVLGIRYDATLIDRDDFFQHPSNLFIHGVVENLRGTCTSLPPVFLAVGRRLGYPLKLVTTKSHWFARWDDGRECFNIECTSLGFVSHSDEHYLSWPLPTTIAEAKEFAFLKSKTPRGELANFMAARGHCLLDNLMHKDAANAYAWAFELEPDCRLHAASMAAALNRWLQSLKRKYADVTLPGATVEFVRRFANLPIELERRFVALDDLQERLGKTIQRQMIAGVEGQESTEHTYTYEPSPSDQIASPIPMCSINHEPVVYRPEDRIELCEETVSVEAVVDTPFYANSAND